MNLGDGTFAEAATAYGLDSLRDGRGLAVADFDRDGHLDLVVNNYRAQAHYFVARTPPAGHWLKVRLRGTRGNRDAIGAVVRARAGGVLRTRVITAGDGYASQSSSVAHFGLGEAAGVDELEVTWPGGRRQAFRGIAADGTVEITEGEAAARRAEGAGGSLRAPE